MQYIPLLFVIIPVIASLVIYLFKYRMISRLVFVFQFLMIAMFIYLLYEGAFENQYHWSLVDGLSFAISFYLDQTS